MITLRKFQQEAYDAWLANGCVGVLKAVTGSGKSYVALKTVEVNPSGVLVIVPTVALLNQWKAHLGKLGLRCGLVGNGCKEFKNITIAVINSLRGEDISQFRLIIADELHRYFSNENYKVIKFIANDSANNKYMGSFLGLSATPERADLVNFEQFIQKVPIIYEHDLEDAVLYGSICKFEVKREWCCLSDVEQAIYDRASETIKQQLDFYGGFHLAMAVMQRGRARRLSEAINERKQVLANSTAKIQKTAELINLLGKKVIVFSEFIDSLELLKKYIKQTIPVCEYHSKMKKKERATQIETFKTTPGAVLLSARALDEGLDIPECDTAIVMSGSSKNRQFVQRLGRILRPGKDKIATSIEIVIKGTIDERWSRTRRIKHEI